MEIVVKELIQQQYDSDEALRNVSPNYLKDEGLEWNKEENSKHLYAEEIAQHDIVGAIENIAPPYERYAYFFIKVKTAKDKTKEFTFDKIIFDVNLNDTFIIYSVSWILNGLNSCCDITDSMVAERKYPLSDLHLLDTKQSVVREVLKAFHAAKGKIMQKQDKTKKNGGG